MADWLELQKAAHEAAVAKGFWEDGFGVKQLALKAALVATEAVELVQGLRKPETTRKALGYELADIVIRALDLAEALGVDLGSAVTEKMGANKTRPRKHGRLF